MGESTVELKPMDLEKMAAQRAYEQSEASRWNTNIAVLAYALLATVLILQFLGLLIEIIASIAVTGLVGIWYIGWRRGQKIYNSIYEQELRQLRELLYDNKTTPQTIDTPLSSRETKILTYISQGYPNKQIALNLGVSQHTIRNQLSTILRKLEVADRTQAAVMAFRNGWILIETDHNDYADQTKQ
jgi:DNA-binding CsgD family transcriptional regulator